MCGHLHPRQVVRVGGAQVVMPGSTERTAFSEAGETKGYAIWTLGAQVSWAFVDLPGRPLVRVDGPADLDRVVPGAIVRGELDPAEVTARGGWPVRVAPRAPRPPPPPQLGLFGARS
jgi:DNA repair exonuclease SbcCD nuclease subunit